MNGEKRKHWMKEGKFSFLLSPCISRCLIVITLLSRLCSYLWFIRKKIMFHFGIDRILCIRSMLQVSIDFKLHHIQGGLGLKINHFSFLIYLKKQEKVIFFIFTLNLNGLFFYVQDLQVASTFVSSHYP